ncbi:MAG: DUF6985 domain-containing protein [Polyangiaceae bacterium]
MPKLERREGSSATSFPPLARIDPYLEGHELIELRPDRRRVRVSVVLVAHSGKNTPTGAQEAAYRYWKAHKAAVFDRVLAAVFVQYQAVRAANPDPPWPMPKVSGPEQLLRRLHLNAIYVHEVEKASVAYLGLGFRCSWEQEHGCGVLVHRDQIIEVGGTAVAFTEWIAERARRPPRQRPPPAWLLALRSVRLPSADDASALCADVECALASDRAGRSEHARLLSAWRGVEMDPYGAEPERARANWQVLSEVLTSPRSPLDPAARRHLKRAIATGLAEVGALEDGDIDVVERKESIADERFSILTRCAAAWVLANRTLTDPSRRASTARAAASLERALRPYRKARR